MSFKAGVDGLFSGSPKCVTSQWPGPADPEESDILQSKGIILGLGFRLPLARQQ